MTRGWRLWVWSIGAALAIGVATGLDVLLIALGWVRAAPGLWVTFLFPLTAGAVVGMANRRASLRTVRLMSLAVTGAIYGLMVAVAMFGLAIEAGTSCMSPNDPSCTDDIGTGVGIVLGIPIAAAYGALFWVGSVATVAGATVASKPRKQ